MNTRMHGIDDEASRVLAVERFKSMDASVHQSFAAAASILQKVTQTSIAGFSLLGTEKQWFRSAIGGDLIETDRKESFCQYAMGSDDLLLIPDARRDPLYERHPLVVGDPRLQFYVGLCIRDADHYPLGALCAADVFPRVLSDNAYFVAVKLRDMLEQMLIVSARSSPTAACA